MAALKRLFLALIGPLLPRAEREWMLGDIEEEAARIQIERGRIAASAWLAAETFRVWLAAASRNLPRGRGSASSAKLALDIRYGLRLMKQSPGFSVAIVATLALGIGANTAIFSVVDALIFRPLPYPGADRLQAIVLASDKPEGMAFWPYPKYAAFAREQQEFDLTAAYARVLVTIDPGGQPQRAEAEVVTSSYFALFGAVPSRGRTFEAEDERVPARDAVVVLGDALWRGTFGADPNVVGRSVTIKERRYAVIGVMPPAFRGQTGTAQLWLPVMMADHFMYVGAASGASSWWMRPVARLSAGMRVEQATARMPALSERVGRVDGSRLKQTTINDRELFRLVPFRDTKIDPAVRTSFVILLGAVGFVLLIACANTANLLLGRAVRRQAEFAVRRALGASEGDLTRQVLTESLLLSIVAGAAAMAVAYWSVAWMTHAKPLNVTGFWSQYGRTFDFFDVTLDRRVALFNFAIALGVGVLFGVLPARQASRVELNEMLKRRSGGIRLNARAALVLAEIALSVILLASAGLMVRSFANAASADLGFEPAERVSMTASLQQGKPVQFYRELLERARAIPGARDAAIASAAPLGGGGSSGPIEIDGRARDETVRAGINVVSPTFFSTAGIDIVSGRALTDDDRDTAPRVAVVSRSFAATAWPGQAAIGKRVRHRFRVAFGDPKDWTTVVGVVDDVVYGTLEEPRTPMLYLSSWQPLGTPAALSLAPDTVIVRTEAASAAIDAMRRELKALDPGSPLYDTTTMAERASNATSRYRYAGALMGALATLALLLAGIGTYGVIAYAVATRTREIGIRMALGARPRDVLQLVMGNGMKLAAVAVLLGLGGAWGATRVLETMLFGVTAHDPATFIVIAAVMGTIAAAATYLPARRAMRVEPTRALRQE